MTGIVAGGEGYRGVVDLGIAGLGNDIEGSIRVQLVELPPALAAQLSTPQEVAFAYFPATSCKENGRPIGRSTPIPEAGGATPEEIFAQLPMVLGSEHAIDARLPDGSTTRLIVEPGELSTQDVCASIGAQHFFVDASLHVHTEDRAFDAELPSLAIGYVQYSGALSEVRASSSDPTSSGRIDWPDGTAAAPEGYFKINGTCLEFP